VDDQTTALQGVIDKFPDCFFAEDMASVTKTFADSFNKSAKGDAVQIANINELLLVGQELTGEGGDGPNPDHSGISGLLCSGSEGRTRFLAAFAKCFRRDYDLTIQRTGVWNSKYWLDAVNETFRDISNGVGKAAEGLGKGLGSALIGLLPLLAVIAILGVVFLVIQKKVA
jgi:hypothetical protein